ncbi:MAG TPA: DUF3558 family protein [Actinophytocola sp.]|nr:DUF3558 family protein [Actinophytocola sp.]
MRTPRIALASLLLLAACSTAEPGEPTAGDPPATTEPGTAVETATPTEQTVAPSASRPRDLDLAAVDICQVVGKLPLREYGLDGDRPPIGGTSVVFPGAKDCFAGGIQNNLSLTLIAVTSEGAGSYVDSANAGKTASTVAGFPLTVLEPANPANCFGVVDVADGQLLHVAYGLGSPGQQPVTGQDKLCSTVPVIAEAAITAIG